MGRHHVFATKASPDVLQEKLDASDIVGRWKWDIVHDRVYADAAVALLFNLEPAVARAGVSLDRYLEAVHPEDRERAIQGLAASLLAGRAYRQEFRVRSADGVTRRILARGRIQCDAAGRPKWGRVLLIDVTQDPLEATGAACLEAHQHPLPLAAEHCMAMRQALYELPEPLLRRMSDMLLLEIGRAMVRAESAEQRSQMN
ncbi:PAS domain-containing protein [Methylobacterium sp. J-078]|uniref:PAS domain-containing protein n=1 Tax=Methylobacterium sp. J-078 TaxID=2836657 RepID=UPI001FB9B6AE|nr:PAS domain-containing protein [Methylobacterium sp. J-078]MCJ2045374.1 PAS domain-containing protein [Methylobacterium sp. J-078]